jgi:hypothetical protein
VLLYQFVLAEAKRKGIHEDRAAAAEWVRAHVGLHRRELDDGTKVVEQSPFDWTGPGWWTWQRRFQALTQLDQQARRHAAFSEKALGPARAALMRTHNVVSAASHKDIQAGRGLRVWFTDEKNHVTAMATTDVETLWQAVFLSFFQPEASTPGPVCRECGNPLKPTKKTDKPSRARLCPSCRVKKWRRENPEAARENWKEAKRRERGEAEGGKK